MFEVGEKVVCVDAKFADWVVNLYADLPEENKVYVVRDIVAGHQPDLSRSVAVLLVGLIGNVNSHGIENGYSCHRFRRLDEVKEMNRAKNSEKNSLQNTKKMQI